MCAYIEEWNWDRGKYVCFVITYNDDDGDKTSPSKPDLKIELMVTRFTQNHYA